ncbi:carbon-nitrogen hydrolase family protein [Candidatus Latescibacterota bacterium]
MSANSRIALVQNRTTPTCDGLRTDPFTDDFSMKDALLSIERKVDWYVGLLDRAGAQQCDLVVLSEDFTATGPLSQYLDDRALFPQAVDLQTALIPERLGETAKRNSMYVVACYYAVENGIIYNVADLLGRDGGLVGRYRKVHLPQYEKWTVAAGDAFPAFETDIGWIGMLICYDQQWPESAACCTMNGAQLICVPSVATSSECRNCCRALDNVVHYIYCTSANSMIASPRAEVLAHARQQDPGIVWADVDLAEASKPQPHYMETLFSGILDHKERHLKFRRPDAYSSLVADRPPLADQYPEGGVAETPEAIGEVYEALKDMRERQNRGESLPYHWNW